MRGFELKGLFQKDELGYSHRMALKLTTLSIHTMLLMLCARIGYSPHF
jgi:hypothetical protein